MLNNIDLEHIKKTNWYRQGGAIYLFYVFGPYHCVHETLGYDKCVIYQEGDVNTAFFGRDEQERLTRDFIKKQEMDKRCIDRWIKIWRIKNKKALRLCERYFKDGVEDWGDRKLVEFLDKFNVLAVEFWKFGVLCEWMDPDGFAILKEIIKKYRVELDDTEINVLTAPEKLTFVQSELIDRHKLVKLKFAEKNIDKLLEEHAKSYFWYKNNWAYIYECGKSHFDELILSDLGRIDKMSAEIKGIKNNLCLIKRRKRDVLDKKKIPSGLKNVLYMFSRMTDWRDERKKMSVCLPNHYLHRILRRLCSQNNMEEAEAGCLLAEDVVGWKISDELKEKAKMRRNGWVNICDKRGTCQEFYGLKAKKIYQKIIDSLGYGQLRGMSANKGNVTGKIKIVETKADFSKMQRGDILVATMTRPEYVPIMKIASAIVTNEGGVTCHAAIVSRELGIPCIIGTQVATEVLKDGDMVEVDAENGIVRKIN